LEIKSAKNNPIIDLFNEGLEFESTIKEVEISIRGNMHKFNIMPMGFVKYAEMEGKRMKIKAGVYGDDVKLDLDNNVGNIKLETVSLFTVEFKDITNAMAASCGARDRMDFTAKALGILGVEQLFKAIDDLTTAFREIEENKTEEFAEMVKN